MAGLKVLGIEQITKKIILESIITLSLFSFAISGLFDLWKLLPTVFEEGTKSPDWWSLFLFLVPVILFGGWGVYVFKKYKHILRTPPVNSLQKHVTSHKGVILALSAPTNSSPDEIINQINISQETGETGSLFAIWSVGQLLKGLYHHKDDLLYVWAISTEKSEPYKVCIKVFLEKFVPRAELIEPGHLPRGYKLTGKRDLDFIEGTKFFLGDIYSEERLDELGLEKTDIVVDITGGTKSISIGMIFGALDSIIDIQYVEQQTGKFEVIPLAVNHEIILDKTSEYLLELYTRIHKSKTENSERIDANC